MIVSLVIESNNFDIVMCFGAISYSGKFVGKPGLIIVKYDFVALGK